MTFALRALDLDWNLKEMSTRSFDHRVGKLTSGSRRLTYGRHSTVDLSS